MKNFLLTVIALLSFSIANAQDNSGFGFSKGDFYVSGSINSKSGQESVTTIAPSISLFVTNNIAVNSVYSIDMAAGNATSRVGIGVGASYHFNANKQFSSNVGLGIGVSTGNEYTATETQMSLSYGVKYFVSNHFILSADIAALKYKLFKNSEGTTNSTDFALNFSNVALGLAYKF